MFRNYFAAALRNLTRNRFYACISVFGLAVGLCAAILIALFVRNEYSYERFLPHYQRTYLVSETISIAGANPIVIGASPAELAAWLKADVPAIEAITRLSSQPTGLRHGAIEANDEVFWSDSNVFSVLGLSAIAGDLEIALQQPDGVVLTRAMARKYFGRDDPIDKVIEFDRQHPMRVRAVLQDLPLNTHLDAQIFASGSAAFSPLTASDSRPAPLASGSNRANVFTYMRLAANASAADAQRAIAASAARRSRMSGGMSVSFPIVAISEVHLHPQVNVSPTRPNGNRTTIYTVSAVALLIAVVAGINFVNLLTARAARRAMEVGVRKALGATRLDLVAQFVGESLLYVALSMILAIALVELLLPQFNAFLGRAMTFSYWRDPTLLAAILALTLCLSGLAGIYPALVLSAIRPAAVLKGHTPASNSGSGVVRQLLVALQFAVLIGLLLITGVIYRQNSFALREGLRFDQEQILVIQSSCKGALRQTIEALPGVRGAACSMTAPTLDNSTQTTASTPAGGQALLWYSSVDFGFFELYGLKPLAGRFFARAYSNDALRDEPRDAPEAIVLNETAVRKLGFPSAAGAVGQVFTCGHAISVAQMRWSKSHPCEVVGVAPDYAVGSIRKPIEPAAYYVFPDQFAVLSVKLSGQQLPETLAAIDSVWTATGDAAPIKRVFLNQRVQELYLDVSRQAQLLAMFSGIAVFIACLGLFGLAAFTAERRTREIGIRKAMGAETCDIVRMLVWQFTKPVLWANLVAWPVAAYVMHRWLEGFAYHIDLAPWLFAVATAVAIGIALLTVGVHSIRVARARPVLALRDE